MGSKVPLGFRLGESGDLLPPAPARRGDPAGVQGGGDLPKRLRPGGLSLTDSWRNDGGVRVSEVPFLGKRI